MGFLKDISGQKFGRITVLSLNKMDKNRNAIWNCFCSCGTYKEINGSNLKRGLIKSCGCLNNEMASKRLSTHGQSKSKEYRSWAGMKERCYNTNIIQYCDYGGRGIIVCEEWINSFETFLSDMGPCPKGDYSIDRINVDGNYNKSNCRWANRFTQNRNKRNTKLSESDVIDVIDSSLSHKELSLKYSVSIKLIQHTITWALHHFQSN